VIGVGDFEFATRDVSGLFDGLDSSLLSDLGRGLFELLSFEFIEIGLFGL